MAALRDWVHEQVCDIMGSETPRAYSEYILQIDSQADVKDYLHQLKGSEIENPQINHFVQMFSAKRGMSEENITVYKKGQNDIQTGPAVKPKKKKEPKKVQTLDDLAPYDTVKTPLDSVKVSPRKKTTYVSLYGKDGEDRTHAVLLPGRHPCECQAQKHKLINNCMACGRVVCEQEGSGPCLYCGEMVCTPGEKKILSRDSRKSEKLKEKLTSLEGGGSLADNDEMSKGLKKAEEYKNRLLDYDRTYIKRTTVIDDESDYFASDSNVWLSQKEREVLKKKEQEMREARFGSRLNRKVTLDFAGRKVIEENEASYYPVEEIPSEDVKPSVNPFIEEVFPDLPMPKFIGKENKKPERKIKKDETIPTPKINRLQDKEIQQMSDNGMCLSMHQPWASLLVKGIKKDEGRNWYSNHRGRLWIAAASHKATPEEIEAIEQQHLQFNAKSVTFPSDYPTSCLLGYVNVDDVLSQEDYRAKYPMGESGSPYVFVCSNFEELLIKLPVSGKHKIWKLPSTIHQAARKARTIHHDRDNL